MAKDMTPPGSSGGANKDAATGSGNIASKKSSPIFSAKKAGSVSGATAAMLAAGQTASRGMPKAADLQAKESTAKKAASSSDNATRLSNEKSDTQKTGDADKGKSDSNKVDDKSTGNTDSVEGKTSGKAESGKADSDSSSDALSFAAEKGSKLAGPGTSVATTVGSVLYSGAKSKARAATGADMDDGLGEGKVKKEAPSAGEQMSKNLGKKAAKGAAAGAIPAAKAMGVVMFLNMLKNFFFTVAAMAANIGNFFAAMFMAAVKAVAGWFAGVGAWVSGVVGGAVSAAVGTFIAGATAAAMLILSAVGIGIVLSDPVDTGLVAEDCLVQVDKVKESNTTPEVGDVDAAKLANAEKIYGVFSAWGMSDENIAGALGNFDTESNIDSTGVETIYDEPHRIGPRKERAESVGFDVKQVHPDYGATYPLIKNVGIGLGQWTDTNDGATGNSDLRAFAAGSGKKWHDIETQLAFMMSDKDQHKKALTDFIANPEGSPEAAALTFARTWEGNTAMAQEERQERAKEWFVRMDSWEKDTALANSLLTQAGATIEEASDKSVRKALNDCIDAKNLDFDNSTIASAMVSYSWPYRHQSIANKGTDLYVEVHDKVLPGDPYYASCDRSVASAVRWAGADDNFPAGPVPTQKAYMDTNSEKWARVPWDGDESKLKPGDIGIAPSEGHIIMYVGEELPKSKYPDGDYEAGANTAEGSLDAAGSQTPNENTQSPHLSGLGGRNNYIFYRNVKTEENSKYKNVVTGASNSFGPVSKDAKGAIKAAESQLGVPYVWGGETPGVALDCSGLTQFAWGQAGKKLTHKASAQYGEGKQIPFADRRAGDLVFWGSGSQSSIYHVAILTSPNDIIHAPVPGDVVKRAPLSGGGSPSAIMPYVVRLG